MPEMTTRQRFDAVMNFQPVDRLPMIEWASWWSATLDRWQAEGLPYRDRYELYRHFGLDVYYQDWIKPARRDCPSPAHHGAGIIRTMADYERLRPMLYPRPAVDGRMWRQRAAEQAVGDAVLWITFDGFFWFARWLLGIEPHMYAFYDAPQLIHRINADLSDWMLDALAEVCGYATPDFMTFGEDMSYNHGSMLSRPLFEEFMAPYYRKVLPAMKHRGILTIIDSDGDVTEPAGWFESVGLDGILPLERQAGVDIARLRAEHPRMRFIGHFDKMTMPHGEQAMRAEFERLLPTMSAGGFLPSVDHQTPPGVSLDNYRIYLRLLAEYAVRAGQKKKTQSS